jgi:hypothetical protein
VLAPPGGGRGGVEREDGDMRGSGRAAARNEKDAGGRQPENPARHGSVAARVARTKVAVDILADPPKPRAEAARLLRVLRMAVSILSDGNAFKGSGGWGAA